MSDETSGPSALQQDSEVPPRQSDLVSATGLSGSSDKFLQVSFLPSLQEFLVSDLS